MLTIDDRLTVGRSGYGVLTLGGGTLVTEELLVGRYSGTGQMAIIDHSAEVTVGTALTLGTNAFFTAEPASVIHMTRSADGTAAALFDNRSTSPFSLDGLADLELSFEGGADLTSTVEVGGNDLGPVESGFFDNFSLGTLRVGTTETPADVMLVDDRDNAVPGSDAEALYVHMIVLSEGSTLDLNGLDVYYHYLCNEGGTVELHDGVLEQVEGATLGDFDEDGDVDFDDLAVFVDVLIGVDPDPVHAALADMNGDCAADGLDVQPFVEIMLAP